jgi:hypothetical protein
MFGALSLWLLILAKIKRKFCHPALKSVSEAGNRAILSHLKRGAGENFGANEGPSYGASPLESADYHS